MNRSIAATIAVLIAALAAIGLLSGDEEAASPSGSERRGPGLEQIARGVERARELEFERLPRVERVSADEARRAGLRELDRQVPRSQQADEERLLTLLGLLRPRAGLRELFGKALAGEVGGYYMPGSDTLTLVRDAGLGGLFADVVLAHELTHALEDQHFDIRPRPGIGFRRDRAVAEGALIEGSATVVMVDYLARSQGGGEAVPPELRTRALAALQGVAVPASSGLPRYLRESLVFPYAAGAALVNEIEGRGGWAAVDRAFGRAAPLSTEQVMHPEKYRARERPLRVRLEPLGEVLPRGARRLSRGDIGEFDTAQFLRSGNGRERAERAAAGWGGATFELWRLPGGRHLLAAGWAWDSARDADEFQRAARRQLGELRGAVGIRRGDGVVAFVVAPDAPLLVRVLRRLAR